MFGSRSKDEKPAQPQAAADLTKQPRDPQAPKGRPTPKRAMAQTQRRTTQVPTNRKEATKRAREARRSDMARQREALATGDERYLPPRDKGQVRRFTRDFVDSRWCVAEFFLPMAVLILVLSMLPSLQVKNISLLLWLGVIVMIIIDSVLLSMRLKKRLREKYPDESHKGATAYALMRTLQMRRMRLPKPQVKRGEKP